MTSKTPEDTMREAELLIEQAKRLLQDQESAPRPALSEEARAMAERLFQEDMQAIDEEIAREKVRRNFTSSPPSGGGVRKPRPMV